MPIGRGFPCPRQSCAQRPASCTGTLSLGTARSWTASVRAAQPLPPRWESTISYLISSSWGMCLQASVAAFLPAIYLPIPTFVQCLEQGWPNLCNPTGYMPKPSHSQEPPGTSGELCMCVCTQVCWGIPEHRCQELPQLPWVRLALPDLASSWKQGLWYCTVGLGPFCGYLNIQRDKTAEGIVILNSKARSWGG